MQVRYHHTPWLSVSLSVNSITVHITLKSSGSHLHEISQIKYSFKQKHLVFHVLLFSRVSPPFCTQMTFHLYTSQTSLIEFRLSYMFRHKLSTWEVDDEMQKERHDGLGGRLVIGIRDICGRRDGKWADFRIPRLFLSFAGLANFCKSRQTRENSMSYTKYLCFLATWLYSKKSAQTHWNNDEPLKTNIRDFARFKPKKRQKSATFRTKSWV